MTIYVCYWGWDYEGYDEPHTAFTTEEKAMAWVEAMKEKRRVDGYGPDTFAFTKIEVEG